MRTAKAKRRGQKLRTECSPNLSGLNIPEGILGMWIRYLKLQMFGEPEFNLQGEIRTNQDRFDVDILLINMHLDPVRDLDIPGVPPEYLDI